jgi:hypothetical protein
VSFRDLTGSSWAVAALLCPAAGLPLLQSLSPAVDGQPGTAVSDLVGWQLTVADDRSADR